MSRIENMCGRFTIISNPLVYQLEFDLQVDPGKIIHWDSRYNVSPTQPVPVVKNSLERSLDLMQWGLVPGWVKDEKHKFRLINVRAETIAEKTFSKRLLQQGKRCFILADGFYEWQAAGQKGPSKTPFYFYLKEHKPFAFAGLWDAWETPDGQMVESCAIITCAPNAMVSPVHDRMPVILDRETSWQWISSRPIPQLLSLLKPYPASEMVSYPVNSSVNNPAVDSEECLFPAENNP